jgi:hypothetical protein
MDNDTILCTAKDCPYEKSCARKQNDEPDNPNLSWCNYGIYCCQESGYDSYIPLYI